MFKRTLAIMLAAVMLLQPTMASAISWGALVEGLHSSGTGSYTSEDGTTAELDGDELTVTGGTVSDVGISDGDAQWATKYTFVDVNIDGDEFRIYLDAETAEVVLKGGSEVNVHGVYVDANSSTASGTLVIEDAAINAHRVEMFAMQGGQVALDNQGNIVVTMDEEGDEYSSGIVRNVAVEGGSVTVNNAGAIETESGVESFANQSSIDFTNDGSIDSAWANFNATNGSDLVVTNGEDGEIRVGDQVYVGASSYDDSTLEHGGKSTMTFDNAGLIDPGRNTYIVAMGDAETTFSNSGTMTNEIYSEVGYSNYGEEDEWYAEAASKVTEDMQTSITINNSGEITDYLATNSWQQGSMDIGNEGEIGNVYMDAFADSTVNMSNSGSVSGELYMGAWENSDGSLENSGEANHLFVSANESGSVTAENKGTVTGDTWFDAMGESDVTISNSGTFENSMCGGADENASLTLENKGTVSGDIYGEGWGEAEVGVTNSGTAGHVWASAFGESTLTATNNGTVEGEFGGGGYEGGKLEIANNGESGSAWIDAFDDANVSYENNGTVAEEIAMQTDGSASLTVASGENATDGGKTAYIFLEEGETLTTEQIAEIMAKADLPEDVVVATVDAEGEVTGEYEIAEDGTVKELSAEAEPEYEPYDEEKIYAEMRAADEALRQSRAVGGVTTSIFWNKQMYLGHSTYNGRVYYDGHVEMTEQSLAWLPGGDAVGKNYTLRINKADVNPADVEIRLAQDILDVCQRAGVAMITIVDKNNAPIAQYAVADLIAAREAYSLAADELICISADMSAEVMKVTAEGEYLPLEPQAEEAAQEKAGA